MAAMLLFERYLRYIPMIAVMGIIFFLSQQPGTTFKLPMPLGADKLAHAALYAILAATAIFALLPARPQKKIPAGLLVVLFCLLYGISDEFHQSFVPGREPSGGDILADTAGAAVAVAVWLRSIIIDGPAKTHQQ